MKKVNLYTMLLLHYQLERGSIFNDIHLIKNLSKKSVPQTGNLIHDLLELDEFWIKIKF